MMFPSKNSSFEPIKALARDHLKTLVEQAIAAHGPKVDLNHIDVSGITDFSGVFYRALFDGNISMWDVSNATSMEMMFEECSFNGDISHWNVANVENMEYMFAYSTFNQDLSRWNVEKVKYMRNMFRSASFSGDLSLWQCTSLLRAQEMFHGTDFLERLSEHQRPTVFHWLHALEDPSLLSVATHRTHLLQTQELALVLNMLKPLDVARLAQQTWWTRKNHSQPECLVLPGLE